MGQVVVAKNQLLQKITNRSAIVAVVGLGYVGLPFAVEKAKVGFSVLGIDQNVQRVRMVNSGESYISDVDTDELRGLLWQGSIRSTPDFEEISDVDVIVICVPTPLTKNLTPDLQFIESVTHKIREYMRPGQLICLESTTYPGTTEEVILPILAASGLTVEEDFFIAHSPERVDPGNQRYTTKNTSKVVGAIGPESLQVAVAFYEQTIGHVVPVSNAKTAELTKVFENTFRAVNIALVNEMSLLCDRMGISAWEVLDAAFTKPFGIMPFYPGPGVGGHCIPVDPHYLEWKAKELNFNTHFIALAGEINRRMPEFVCEKTIRLLNQRGLAARGARVLVLGVAYKRNCADYRESPAIDVIRLLLNHGMDVDYYDPHVQKFESHGLSMSSLELLDADIGTYDLVLVATDHELFDYEAIVHMAQHVFDTRNATRNVNGDAGKVTLL